LRSSIKHSLGQFNVAPVLDFDRDANLDTPYNYKDLKETPTIQVDSTFNPFFDDKVISITLQEFIENRAYCNWESLYVGLKQEQSFFN
jgi:DNA mismatch repair protein MutL